jgi:hypothetical protein
VEIGYGVVWVLLVNLHPLLFIFHSSIEVEEKVGHHPLFPFIHPKTIIV